MREITIIDLKLNLSKQKVENKIKFNQIKILKLIVIWSGTSGISTVCCNPETGQTGNVDTTDCVSQWTQGN